MARTKAATVGVEARPIIKNEELTVEHCGGLGLGTVGKRKEERRARCSLVGKAVLSSSPQPRPLFEESNK